MTICPRLEVGGQASASRTSLGSSKTAIGGKLAVRISPSTRSRSLDRSLPCTGSFYTSPCTLNCLPCCSNANVVLDFRRVSLRSRFSNTLAFGGSIRSDSRFFRACKTDFGTRLYTCRWTLCRNNVQLPPASPGRRRTRTRRSVGKIRSDSSSILTERTWTDISDSERGVEPKSKSSKNSLTVQRRVHATPEFCQLEGT